MPSIQQSNGVTKVNMQGWVDVRPIATYVRDLLATNSNQVIGRISMAWIIRNLVLENLSNRNLEVTMDETEALNYMEDLLNNG